MVSHILLVHFKTDSYFCNRIVNQEIGISFVIMALLSVLFSMLLALPIGLTDTPVSYKTSIQEGQDSLVILNFDLKIQRGWHVYSTDMPADGPVGASITIDSICGLEPYGGLNASGKEIEHFDDVFGMDVRYFENNVRFFQKFLKKSDAWYASGYLIYAACNDVSCIPPTNVDFEYSGGAAAVTAPEAEGGDTPENYGMDDVPGYDSRTWQPAEYDAGVMTAKKKGLWGVLLTSFLGGLIALLTPCVWPVIPMTVSFFLKRADTRKSAVRDAVMYGVSIVAVYVSLGLLITLIFGASALNSLSTNAMVNIAFFAILVLFALSFFGLYEITLPSGWSTGLSKKSSSAGGFAGIFLMALTLSVVSFSCTGPIIGFLLVDAASTGSLAAPLTGMTGFALALAIPFALFAMFPHWLQSMPKSGAWMDKVKVTLGFIELAFSLKFLSVADMAYGWGILPRGLFVLLWILMAVCAGLYLLGINPFRRSGDRQKPGVVAVITAAVLLLFAVWMVPGLFGAPLKAISAFTPPMSTQSIRVTDDIVLEPDCTDYNEGLQLAASSGKPVLLDFTGYGCVNCRKMEASVWTDPEIAARIRDGYVLVSLYVDDKTRLDRTITVMENGSPVRIRTVGDKWSLLQRYKFGANAQPFYVIVDAEGRMLAGPYTFDTDKSHFKAFLDR